MAVPTTAGMPYSRATTAQWLNTPPLSVTMAAMWAKSALQAGVVVGVEKYKRDGSGLISGLRAADGLIELAEDITEIGEGDPVLFRPFGSYGLD